MTISILFLIYLNTRHISNNLHLDLYSSKLAWSQTFMPCIPSSVRSPLSTFTSSTWDRVPLSILEYLMKLKGSLNFSTGPDFFKLLFGFFIAPIKTRLVTVLPIILYKLPACRISLMATVVPFIILTVVPSPENSRPCLRFAKLAPSYQTSSTWYCQSQYSCMPHCFPSGLFLHCSLGRRKINSCLDMW